MAIAVALLLGLGILVSLHEPGGTSTAGPPAPRVIHFVEQSAVADSENIDFGVRSQGAYEQWYHFPQAGEEAFLYRMQRWNPQHTQKLCWWVQNEDANYYVYTGDNTAYARNARLYHRDLRVRRLPSDPETMWQFIEEIEAPVPPPGQHAARGVSYERDAATGYLSSRVDVRFPELGPFHTEYSYSDVDPEPALFADPRGAKLVDERDEMHRRGWTWFRITGTAGGRSVSGKGRLPFTYRSSRQHPAWLRLEVEDGRIACHTDQGRWLLDPDHGVAATAPAGVRSVAVYEGGMLLEGMPRPWTGFHTLDVIRRDAARQRIWFSTEILEPDRLAQITLLDASDSGHRMARYLVDLPNDLLTEAHFWASSDGVFREPAISLRFAYLDDVAGLDAEFVQPAPPDPIAGVRKGRPDPLWPLLLVQNDERSGDRRPTAAGTQPARP